MKNGHFLSLLYALCVLVLFSIISATHGQGTVTLIGTVKGQGGSPKDGARVQFSPRGYIAVTDRNGRFVVRNFIPGTYTITVREGGNYQKILDLNIQSQIELKVSW